MQAIGGSTCSPASARFYKFCAKVLQPSHQRHQSTYRRARSKLNIKPDPSFLPSKTEPHDHIIYNPPPSMPNIYHTPTCFLPQSDRRRALQATAAASLQQPQSTSIPTPDQAQIFPPPVRKPYEKKYHLTEKEVLEIRELRRSDPLKWSVIQLAKKFDCSGFYVQMVTKDISDEKRKQQRLVTETVKSNWGVKRRVAREDRAIRKERWMRDE